MRQGLGAMHPIQCSGPLGGGDIRPPRARTHAKGACRCTPFSENIDYGTSRKQLTVLRPTIGTL